MGGSKFQDCIIGRFGPLERERDEFAAASILITLPLPSSHSLPSYLLVGMLARAWHAWSCVLARVHVVACACSCAWSRACSRAWSHA